MGNVNNQFILSTLVIILGYIIKKFNIISENEGKVLAKLVLNVTLPAVVISTFSNVHFESSLILLPLISIFYGLLITSLSFFLYRKEDRNIRGMLSMLMPGFNVGLFAYPLVEAIMGKEAIKYLGMFDMGAAFNGFVIAYIIGSYFSPGSSNVDTKTIIKKLTKSIPLITYIVTLIVLVMGLNYPVIIVDVANIIARANMPLALLVLGIFFSFNIESHNWPNIIKVLGFRYLVGLTIGLFLYYILPLNSLYRSIIVISLILPPPVVMIPYAIDFNYNYRFVGTILNISNMISYLFMWITFNILT